MGFCILSNILLGMLHDREQNKRKIPEYLYRLILQKQYKCIEIEMMWHYTEVNRWK